MCVTFGYIDETRWTAFSSWMKTNDLLSGGEVHEAFKNIDP
jgi:hypothetical protein